MEGSVVNKVVNTFNAGLNIIGLGSNFLHQANVALSSLNVCQTIGQSNTSFFVDVDLGNSVATFVVTFNKGKYTFEPHNWTAQKLSTTITGQESTTVGPLSIQRDGKQLQLKYISELSKKVPVNKATLSHDGANFVTKVGSEWYGVVRIGNNIYLNPPASSKCEKVEVWDQGKLSLGDLLVSRNGDEVTIELVSRNKPATISEQVKQNQKTAQKSNVPTRPKHPVPEIRPIVARPAKKHPAYTHYPKIASLIERAMKGDTSFLSRQPTYTDNPIYVWAKLIEMDIEAKGVAAKQAEHLAMDNRSYIVGEIDAGWDGPTVVDANAEYNAWVNYYFIDAPMQDRANPQEAYGERRSIIPLLEERGMRYRYDTQSMGLYYGPYLSENRRELDLAAQTASLMEDLVPVDIVIPTEEVEDNLNRGNDQKRREEESDLQARKKEATKLEEQYSVSKVASYVGGVNSLERPAYELEALEQIAQEWEAFVHQYPKRSGIVKKMMTLFLYNPDSIENFELFLGSKKTLTEMKGKLDPSDKHSHNVYRLLERSNFYKRTTKIKARYEYLKKLEATANIEQRAWVRNRSLAQGETLEQELIGSSAYELDSYSAAFRYFVSAPRSYKQKVAEILGKTLFSAQTTLSLNAWGEVVDIPEVLERDQLLLGKFLLENADTLKIESNLSEGKYFDFVSTITQLKVDLEHAKAVVDSLLTDEERSRMPKGLLAEEIIQWAVDNHEYKYPPSSKKSQKKKKQKA